MSVKRLFLVIPFIMAVSLLGFTQEKVKSVSAVKTGTPEIDGVFKDGEWLHGGKASGFVQVEPAEGEASTEKTEAFFLYDNDFIYVGIRCYDSEPEKIVKTIGRRDKIEETDYVSVYLDTFHDHRNSYQFAVNPAGTKDDGRFYNDNMYDNSWDGVWWVKTNFTDFGWIAEFKIPFSTLKFAEKDIQSWGLNLRRIIARKNEIVFWQGVKREDLGKVSLYGHLENLQGIKPGMNLEVLPYISSSVQKDRTNSLGLRNDNGITGLDLKYGITSNITATFTLNPDFAQIESDEDMINLTRYPLYLQEKRPFFTEGSSIFKTAGDNMMTGLFYSRRINEPVYGLKINGKAGKWNLGVLHSLNNNDGGIEEKIEDGEIPENTKTNAFYNVIRMSRDIFSRSDIGIIAMSKEYSGGYNRILGFDAGLRFRDYYVLDIETAISHTERSSEKNTKTFIRLWRQADFFSFALVYDDQAPGFFGNDLGFYSYNDFRLGRFWFGFGPRMEKIGIRQLKFYTFFEGENFWNKNFFAEETMGRIWGNRVIAVFNNWWQLWGGYNFGKSYDRIDDILYPADYYFAGLSNNKNSKVFFDIMHSQGEYRTGYSWSYDGSVRIRPADKIDLELSYNRSLTKLIDEDTGIFERNYYEVWRTKFYYLFKNNLNARVIFQYSGMDKRFDMYYLLAYNFRPKSFLYIAYTECFDEDSFIDRNNIERFPKFSSSNKIFQVKLSNLFMW